MSGLRFFAQDEQAEFLLQARGFLSAARFLRFSESWKHNPRLIIRPTLHLLSHGAELLLKFGLLEQGATKASVKQFGHDLTKLWNAAPNAEVRQLVLRCAQAAWQEARSSGEYPDDDFSGDPHSLLVEALSVLSGLHGRESDFGLRYTLPPDTLGPRPAFLICAFGDAADELVKAASDG